jgi:hypothetical protein
MPIVRDFGLFGLARTAVFPASFLIRKYAAALCHWISGAPLTESSLAGRTLVCRSSCRRISTEALAPDLDLALPAILKLGLRRKFVSAKSRT